MLITLDDITTITGLDDASLESLIPYAETQAEAMLGYLNKETKNQEFYVWDKSDTFKLDFFPVNSISTITYKVSAGSDEETYETDEYRTILADGLIIFDIEVPENRTLKVTYEIGWDTDDVTDLVKLFLVALTANQYYSLNPELSLSSKVITQEKIGDYMVKYSGLAGLTFKSLDQWVDYLAMLIKKGGNTPDSDSV